MKTSSREAFFLAVCLFGFSLSCCNASATIVEKTFTERSAQGSQRVLQVREGLGIACQVGDQLGWASYRVSDLGKPDVPLLNQRERKQLNQILRFVHPATLRFVKVSGDFYVFDWQGQRDLCDPDAPPTFVLNGACNEYYQPVDLVGTMAAPSCSGPSRPWIPHDAGIGSGRWSPHHNR